MKNEEIRCMHTDEEIATSFIDDVEAVEDQLPEIHYDICGDDRFEIIEKAKQHLLSATNIEDSKEEMAVLDTFLFRCWQMGWLDRYA